MTRVKIPGHLVIYEAADGKYVVAFEMEGGHGWYLNHYQSLPPEWAKLMEAMKTAQEVKP